MVLILPERITVILIFNWRGSMCITTKLPVVNMFPVQSLSIWSLVPWTQCAPVLLGKSFDQITLFLVKVELETTGLKDITQKELSWWIQSWMWCVKKLKVVIACKDFS